MTTRQMIAALDRFIERNGERFACGCRVREQGYVTRESNASKPGRRPSIRVRCLRHHRQRSAALMRLRRSEARS